jgi:hypothetical protein
MADYHKEDKDGGDLALASRVIEICPEHIVKDRLGGQLLRGATVCSKVMRFSFTLSTIWSSGVQDGLRSA